MKTLLSALSGARSKESRAELMPPFHSSRENHISQFVCSSRRKPVDSNPSQRLGKSKKSAITEPATNHGASHHIAQKMHAK